MTTMTEAIHRRLRAEAGFTMIEVLVAAALAAVALVAMFGSFDSSRRLIDNSERIETVTHIAEQELERIIARDYATVATASLPTRSTDQFNPRYYITASGTGYEWDQTGARPAENFVPAAGTLPACSPWADSVTRLSGEVCRFVTEIKDPNIVQTPTDLPDAKRVTIAVSVAQGKTKPVTLTSIVWNRKA